MEQVTCNTCGYYHRHYVLSEGKIIQIHCGHCTYGRIRTKRPTAKACDNYSLSDPPENAFVTREYLTRELLEYIMKMELLPPVVGVVEKTERERLWKQK